MAATTTPEQPLSLAAALRFAKAVTTREFSSISSFCTPTATWSVFASRPYGGILPVAVNAKNAEVLKTFETFTFDVVSTTTEGNRTAIEATSRGDGPGSLTYRNTYLLMIKVDNKGKIASITEAPDGEVLAKLAHDLAELQKCN